MNDCFSLIEIDLPDSPFISYVLLESGSYPSIVRKKCFQLQLIAPLGGKFRFYRVFYYLKLQ